MSDYTPNENYTTKDGLSTGDPDKIILGAELDSEFSDIATAITSKYDVSNLSSQAQAEAGTDSTTLMTPERVEQAMDALLSGTSGVDLTARVASLDISGLTNETAIIAADEFAYYDDSASLHRAATWTAIVDALVGTASATGIRSNSEVITLDLDSLTNVTPAAGDEFAVADASDSGNPKAILFSTLESTLDHDSLSGFVSDEHVAHASVSIGTAAASGLSGGGTIAATRALIVDISGMSAFTGVIENDDGWLINDAGTSKLVKQEALSLPTTSDSNAHSFVDAEANSIVYYTGTGGHSFTMPTGIGQDECAIVVINTGSGTVTLAGSGVTLTTAAAGLDLEAGGIAVLIRESTSVWHVGGTGLVA